ncbi:MAG: cob(I)yrinic acid a,c-diamide adenosyltransferase [Pseudomonadota bacterium]
MTIVTKKGDKKKTQLVTGEEVSKASIQIEAFGALDVLNSFLGLARSTLTLMKGEGMSNLAKDIKELQMDLFRFGTELGSTNPASREWVELTSESHVKWIEGRITALEEMVKLPSAFVIPGACQASAMVDMARSIARKVERYVVALAEEGAYDNPQGLIYVNRLSDYLFLLARAIEHFAGISPDIKE